MTSDDIAELRRDLDGCSGSTPDDWADWTAKHGRALLDALDAAQAQEERRCKSVVNMTILQCQNLCAQTAEEIGALPQSSIHEALRVAAHKMKSLQPAIKEPTNASD